MPTGRNLAHDVALVRATEVETLAGEPGAVRLLLDSSQTGGALSTQRVTLRNGADGAVPHHHERSCELFFVLAGEAELLAGQSKLTLTEGDAVAIPPHLAHAFAAASGKSTDLLIVIAPGVERFDYFRQLARVMVGDLPAASLLGEQQRFDTYFEQSTTWR